jgi:hypothetical protein
MRTVAFHDLLPPASQLGFGCASLGSRYDRTQSLRALAIAYDHGVNVFDTARSYGYGDSEGILGEFLRDRRSRAIVCTKAGIRVSRPARNGRALRSVARRVFAFAPSLRTSLQKPLNKQHSHGHFEPQRLRESVEESLRELRTDRVDVLFLHDVSVERASADDVMALLDELRSEGKVVLAGPSTSVGALSELTRSPRALGTAIQFPASASGIGTWKPEFVNLVSTASPSRPVRLGNRPFDGGGPLSAGMATRLSALGPLHEMQIRLPVVAGVCDAVVTAMLNPEHIVANCRALSGSRASDAELAALARSFITPAKEETWQSPT